MERKKIVKNIALFIFSIFIISFVIYNYKVTNKLFLRNKNISNIVLYYDDKNITEYILENVQNMTFDERMKAYSNADIRIKVKEEYWDKIIKIIKSTKYNIKNIEIFFGKRYKPAPSLYNLTIESNNGKKLFINIWEYEIFMGEMWYDIKYEAKGIFNIIEEIINENNIE